MDSWRASLPEGSKVSVKRNPQEYTLCSVAGDTFTRISDHATSQDARDAALLYALDSGDESIPVIVVPTAALEPVTAVECASVRRGRPAAVKTA